MSEQAESGSSRRDFLATTTGGAIAGALAGAAMTACPSADTTKAAPPAGAPGQRVLIKGGVVLTMDPKLGDFDKADVLIEGSKIAAVGPNLTATATEVDASNTIVMPGFVDTHRHIWQGQLRNVLPNGRLDPEDRKSVV